MFQIVENTCKNIIRQIEQNRISVENIRDVNHQILQCMDYLKENLKSEIYNAYQEFFNSFRVFSINCLNYDYFLKNKDLMLSTIRVFVDCLEEMKKSYQVKKCVCCGNSVIYRPLSSHYSSMQIKYGVERQGKSETLNKEEYTCPRCGSSDRDRLIISYLQKGGLQKATENSKVLQFAPAKCISDWIIYHCPHVEYHTTDLFMNNVTFPSDIQNMSMVKDGTYDLIICSHVLEHVRDDEKAMEEMKRVLKEEGKIVFLVPLDLACEAIDEEWGLTEEENWKRFGQGDHCRRYSKKGLLDRLNKYFCVHQLGIDYFGKDSFRECGLLDSSILYVLTKTEDVKIELEEEIVIDEKLCTEGPLVSVILPCYNHEEYVAEAIESIINQSYKNIEIIVSDDASTDRTVDILKKYSQYFAKEIYLEKNTSGTIGDELLKYVKGKYVAIAHSDDIWEANKIALQVQYMENHEECGVCLTWSIFIDEKLNDLESNLFIKGNRSQHEWMNYFWKNGNTLCNPSSLTRKEIALRSPKYGYSLWRQLPDFFKWTDIIQEKSIHILPKIMVKMRWHTSNGKENTSAITQNNMRRHMVEEGSSWLSVIRDMSGEFFKKSFCDLMVCPDAQSEIEIKCEKFLLLLRHRNVFVQNTAFIYLCEVYGEIFECLKNQYGYTRDNLAEDMITKGIIQLYERR